MRVEVKVIPRARREEIVEEEGRLRAYVRVAPEKGKANKVLVDLLSRKYGVTKKDIRIIKGETSRVKIIEVITR